MDSKMIKSALSYSLASDLHDAWCRQELYSYFLRAQKEYAQTRNFGEAFRRACFNGDDKRNEVELDIGYLIGHESYASRCLTDFGVFLDLFQKGIISVKRFTTVQISPDEAMGMGVDYRDGEENVLRDFQQLSSESTMDALGAARVAIDLVYDRMVSGENISPEEIEQMGARVHEEWLRRNLWVFDPERGDPNLAVSYGQLSPEEKDKDKAQIYAARDKVYDYLDGVIDIDDIFQKFGIHANRYQL